MEFSTLFHSRERCFAVLVQVFTSGSSNVSPPGHGTKDAAGCRKSHFKRGSAVVGTGVMNRCCGNVGGPVIVPHESHGWDPAASVLDG